MSIERHAPPGIRFSNQRLERQGSAIDVIFDIQWSGSWGPGQRGRGFCQKNWDAAWVFFKYLSSGPWYVPYAEIAELADASELAEEERDACGDLKGQPQMCQKHLAERFDWESISPLFRAWWNKQWSPAKQARGLHVRRIKAGLRWSLYIRDSPAEPIYRVDIEHCQEKGSLKLSTINQWRHARIIEIINKPKEAKIALPEDGTGVFIYRDAEAPPLVGGMAEYRGITLRCVLRDLPANIVESSLAIWPFGLEMVYVPEGPFWLGDPLPPDNEDRPRNGFFDSLTPEASEAPERKKHWAYSVDSEGPIDVGPPGAKPPHGVTKLLWYDNDDDARGAGDHPRIYGQEDKLPEERWEEGRIGEQFPKGFAPYYVMKRQVSQGEYAAFINTLNGGRGESYGQLVRYAWAGAESNRGTIQMPDPKNHERIAWRPLRANNHMSWADAIAFAAWAGLRPMTELEYEKACRGPEDPVPGEFAWGKGMDKRRYATTIFGEEDGSEVVWGTCNIAGVRDKPFQGGDGGQGPVRDDAFDMRGHLGRPAISTSAVRLSQQTEVRSDGGEWVTEREDRGLSYYGIAALTGNLWELCVTIGTPEGRAFRGAHGFGELTEHGEAPYDDLGWPDQTARSVSWRGGSWYTDWRRGHIAARPYGSGAPGFFLRSPDAGFRAVRSAYREPEQAIRDDKQHIPLRSPDKLVSWLSPAGRSVRVDDKMAAAMHDMSVNWYQYVKERARSLVYRCALEYRMNDRWSSIESPILRGAVEAINAMRLPHGSTILGIGDGIGDDHGSFLETLRYLLAMFRREDDLKVVNAGMMDLTTPDLVAHFARLVSRMASAKKGMPAVIICLAGMNDALRLEALKGRTRVGIEETRANLRALRDLVKDLADPPRWVWMVQTNVDEEKVVLMRRDLPARLLNKDLDEVAQAAQALANERNDEVLYLDKIRSRYGLQLEDWLRWGGRLSSQGHRLVVIDVINAINQAMARAT